jgi:hypothetical protein
MNFVFTAGLPRAGYCVWQLLLFPYSCWRIIIRGTALAIGSAVDPTLPATGLHHGAKVERLS